MSKRVCAALLVLLLCAWPLQAAPKVLRRGDEGTQVQQIQTRLKKWGYYDGAVDGVFGSGTEAAVKRFQRRYGLQADGIVGSATAAKLGITLGSGSSGGGYGAYGGYSGDDVYLLARVVYAEARGESYTGKVAVAAVVLNRVKSKSFPNTVAGVVYQKNAFTAVNDGQINLTPDSTALQAVRDAINGWDPSNGALYYYNPKISSDDWIFSREVVAEIGNHRFAV